MSLKVTIIQSDLYWENVAENLAMFSEKIDAISAKTDIVVLPEMFNTGFSMESKKLAETMKGKTVAWMKKQAKQTNAVIVGSLIIKSPSRSPRGGDDSQKDVPLLGGARGGFFNRLIWAQPDGKILTYDKRHLFRMAGEHKHFTAGESRLIVEYKGWRICPLICYDLRFPVWSRNINFCHPERVYTELNRSKGSKNSSPVYDILIYIANWPAVRKQPWSKLLEARAIENQCYVVGVNRVGEDGNGHHYSGNSVIVNPKGDVVSNISENENCTETLGLSLSELNDFREKFPLSLDGDEFEIKNSPLQSLSS